MKLADRPNQLKALQQKVVFAAKASAMAQNLRGECVELTGRHDALWRELLKKGHRLPSDIALQAMLDVLRTAMAAGCIAEDRPLLLSTDELALVSRTTRIGALRALTWLGAGPSLEQGGIPGLGLLEQRHRHVDALGRVYDSTARWLTAAGRVLVRAAYPAP